MMLSLAFEAGPSLRSSVVAVGAVELAVAGRLHSRAFPDDEPVAVVGLFEGTSRRTSTAGASAQAIARGFSIRSCTLVPGSTESSIFFLSCTTVKSASVSSVSNEVSCMILNIQKSATATTHIG